MKVLPELIRKNYFNYTLVQREKSICMYKQVCDEGILMGYEVFKVRILKEGTKLPNGKIMEEGEMFPGNEDFGKTAYSCNSLERAQERFNELLNNIENEK